jgi:iron complex outermembrane receptor protein
VQSEAAFGFEKLWAHEFGARRQIGKTLSLDLALFYHDYSDLSLFEARGMAWDSHGILTVPLRYRNGSVGESYGAELTAVWLPTPAWGVYGSYSWLGLDTRVAPDVLSPITEDLVEGRSPAHQGNVRISWSLPRNIEWDTTLFGAGGLPAEPLPGYFRADMRLAWRFSRDWEISVTGQNLIGPPREEFSSENYTARTLVRRSLLFQMSRGF